MGKQRSKNEFAFRLIVIIGIFLLVSDFAAVGADGATGAGTRSPGGAVALSWISVNRTDNQETPILEAMTEPNTDILIKFAGNYSGGWQNSTAEIKAWYDRGQTGNSSVYPFETGGNRNSAFRIRYCPVNKTAWVIFPLGDLEISIVQADDTVSQANPLNPGQSIHLVEVKIQLGPQVWKAMGGGFTVTDNDYDRDPGKALLDPWSWDLNITLSDKNNPNTMDSLYGEFGIHSSVTLMMGGNPSVMVEPGDFVKMDVGTNIRLSSNSVYWVNVSTSNLLLNGVGPEFIPVTNISVRNTHPLANASNSGISGEPVAFAGENSPLSVWGLEGAYMPPAGNGTCTAGPWMTDYNSDSMTTQLEWWVSVPRGTPLGTYRETIVVTIEPGTGEPIVIGQKQMSGIQVVDLTPPMSEVTRANARNVTAEAYDGETKVENVTLWYRFSEDNVTWSDWTEYETDQQAPWFWDWDSPEGEGYYEFYTEARDSGNNPEQPPLTADASVQTDNGLPGFELPTIAAALAISMFIFRARKRKKL